MQLFILSVAAAASIYGIATSVRPGTPLFYRIVSYGAGSYFLGAVYSTIYTSIYPWSSGFNAGYLGYMGTFFFLFSSYFGALDRLADGREPEYRIYRAVSIIPPVAVAVSALFICSVWQILLVIPAAAASYYACKHLIMPDVEMGIIRVMRPYNLIILLFCLIQPLTLYASESDVSGSLYNILSAVNVLLVAAALPVARQEVKKWFI